MGTPQLNDSITVENNWFHNCLKTHPCNFFKFSMTNYNKASEMEWLCNNKSFHPTWKHACKMADKAKWEK